jgi:hypothetical protein
MAHSKAPARSPSPDDARPAAAALDILDKRFARGEIDKDEYLEKKQLISERASPPKVDQPKSAPVAEKPVATRTKQPAQQR